MALIAPDEKALFIQVPATGCSAAAVTLRQLGFKDIGGKHNSLPQLLAQNVITEDQAASMQVVATVRNPLERWLTAYARFAGGWYEDHFRNRSIRSQWIHERGRIYKIKRKLECSLARIAGFNLWLRSYWWRNLRRRRRSTTQNMDLLELWRMDFCYPMLEGVDTTLKYERLQEDFARVFSQYGNAADLAIPVANATPNRSSSKAVISPRALKFIHSEFGACLERYGHDERLR